MTKEKKIPLRKCLGCGEMKPKRELMRVVRSPEGEVSLDLTGKKNGRGAYLCQNKARYPVEGNVHSHTAHYNHR